MVNRFNFTVVAVGQKSSGGWL